MNGAVVFFLVLAIGAVAAAVGMLFSRNAVYSAIFLVFNFTTVAVLYLTLGAPFIALAQITVYAGAIMVLFLFVIMLLGAEKLSANEPLAWQRPLAIGLGTLLLGEAVYLVAVQSGMNAPLQTMQGQFGGPVEVGLALFNRYLLPFEVTSILLLVALIGAIVLTKVERIRPPRKEAKLEGREPNVESREQRVESREKQLE
jgi:NADH-quinone oxidoreductase subunit J